MSFPLRSRRHDVAPGRTLPPARPVALRLDGVVLPPLRDARLTVAVGEVALVLAGGPDARGAVRALLDCAAGRRAPALGGVRWALAEPPGVVIPAGALRDAVRERSATAGPLVVVDGRRDAGGALAALLDAAGTGRAVLAAAHVDALAPAVARAMLGAAALLRVRGVGTRGGWTPCLALWSVADGRVRLHARVAREAAAARVARPPGPS